MTLKPASCIPESRMPAVRCAGSYGKVFKALRGEVQDVAVKQLLHAGDGQLESFMEVMRHCTIVTSLKFASMAKQLMCSPTTPGC